jgi:sec-independent protein translocase protein TatA
MFANIGFTEILLILAVALLLFGAGSIPKIGKSIGEGIVEFKKAIKGDDEKKKDENKEE